MSADLVRARMLLEVGRAAEARELLAGELAAEPDSFEALALVAHACYVLDDFEAQREAADRMITLAPEEELGHRLRALACAQLDRHAEAIQNAREAVRLDPLEYRTHLVLSSVLRSVRHGPLRRSMLDEAWSAAMHAVRLAPERADTHLEAGIVALQQDRKELSRDALHRALEIDPENTTAMSMLGELRLARGREPEAAQLFRAALNADPGARAAEHGLAGIARRFLRRLLIVVSAGLVPVLVLLRAEAPVARAVAVGSMVVAAGVVVRWSLRRMEPAVRQWLVSAVRRDRRLAARTLTIAAAFVATVALGVVPGSSGEPFMIAAVLAVGVAWWVVLVS